MKKYFPFLGFISAILVIALAVLFIIIEVEKSWTKNPSIKFTIVGTNDIHGKYYASLLSREDNFQKYTYGGLEVMAKLVQILKNENPLYFLYLDAGDQFQGGFQSSKEISSGKIISDYFNHMHLGSSAVGNHEFDFGQQFLNDYLEGLHNKILSANLVDSRYNESNLRHLPLHNQQASKIYSFPIPKEFKNMTNLTEIKIGLIGLATIETLYTTSGFTEHMFPQSYEFENYAEVVTNQSKKLKLKGVNAIILISHVGNQCRRDTTFGIWTQTNMGEIQKCKKDDEMFNLIDLLPQNTIDAVVQGHRHSTSHYFYKGIPIMGTINDGNYLNVLHLNLILKEDQIQVDETVTEIQGPVPVCQKIFQNTRKCEYVQSQDLKQAGNLVSWNFHGVKVQKDEQLSNLAKEKWSKIMQKYEIEIAHNFIPYPLQKMYEAQNPLGNLITNLMANYLTQNQYNFNFIILNAGSFRATWYPGVIRYAELHSMFPFDNKLSFFNIKGEDLRKAVQLIQNGRKGFYPTWGLSQVFKEDSEGNQLNLIELVLADGSPVIGNHMYRVATNSFLAEGGDDFKDLSQYLLNVEIEDILIRDIIKEELQKQGEITEENLKDPTGIGRLVILN